MNLPKFPKRVFGFGAVVVGALLAEFFILEEAVGISWPSDRYSALSRLEITVKAREVHFISRNTRFTAVDTWTQQPLVLRESFFCDQQVGREGPPDATVTVEGMVGTQVRWTFHEPGERGDVVTNHIYRVEKEGNGETPNVYIYFSLVDGRKVRTNRSVEISREELESLDGSLAK